MALNHPYIKHRPLGHKKLACSKQRLFFIFILSLLMSQLAHGASMLENIDQILQEHVTELAKQSLHEARWNYPVPKYMQQEECEQLILAVAVNK